MKYVLILATGRSGSTTLQRIINTIPKTMLYGENCGLIWSLIKCHIDLARFKSKVKDDLYILEKKMNISLTDKKQITYNEYIDNNHPPIWYNVVDHDNVNLKITDIISDIIYDTDKEIIGFKHLLEIKDDNLSILKKFIELFPDTKIIINYRKDIESQSKSKWWGNLSNPESTELLNCLNKLSIDLYNNFNKQCYLMEFNDIFNVNKVKEMFDFLGKELNEEE
jgi:hypothetical protein